MSIGAMAIDAIHIVFAHVNVEARSRIGQRLVKIAMLHCIATAAFEMTAATI
jgi:hypothetical protein